MRLNRPEEAGHWYRESLRAKPDHIPAHLTYAKLLSLTVSQTSSPLPSHQEGLPLRTVLLKVSS